VKFPGPTRPSDAWQCVFAVVGALVIGLTAAVRLSRSDGWVTEAAPHMLKISEVGRVIRDRLG
jgi:hypothetical protein